VVTSLSYTRLANPANGAAAPKRLCDHGGAARGSFETLGGRDFLLDINAHDLPGMSRSAAIKAFVAIAYALSITLSFVVGLTGGYESPLIGLRYLSMFIPAVAMLIVNSAMNEDLQVDWNRLPLKYMPLALLLLPVVIHAAIVPVTAAYEGRLPWKTG
jgi:hypothetical protein